MGVDLEALLVKYLANGERLIEAAKEAPAGEGWNASQIIGHLIDSARVNIGRLYSVAGGGKPAGDWDQEGFVAAFGYAATPLQLLAGELRLRRQAVAGAARSLCASIGDEYFLTRFSDLREHDEEHLRQLRGG